MKILVINTGSSSIKYELFDMGRSAVLASGIVERIGEKSGNLTHSKTLADGTSLKKTENVSIPDHRAGLKRIVALLLDSETGVIRKRSEIAAVGHRVVHGGEDFHSTSVIDEKVMEALRQNVRLAPLHNPANITGIEISRDIFPEAVQVAVFDTAFHQTIPMKAFLYAIPIELYEKERIRKYGFHGTSHAYVAEKAALFLGVALEELNLITIHLGNGASMAALRNGKCVDTSMGMTPLGGLVMGTRSGDVDPALPFFLADNLRMSLKDIDKLLNEKSGLKGLCGTNDMREVIEKRNSGDERAQIALELYCYRVKKYIGAYFAVLGDLDTLVFTAGIGENSPEVRRLCCEGLSGLGIQIDPERNNRSGDEIRDISVPESPVRVLVIPTDEEFKIAQETLKALKSR